MVSRGYLDGTQMKSRGHPKEKGGGDTDHTKKAVEDPGNLAATGQEKKADEPAGCRPGSWGTEPSPGTDKNHARTGWHH